MPSHHPIQPIRIASIRATQVLVPTKPGSTNSPGMGEFLSNDRGRGDWDRWPIVLLEVRFADGITGLGEVGRGSTLAQIESTLRQLVGLQLTGPSLGALPVNWHAFNPWGLTERLPWGHWLHAPNFAPIKPALEMALLDYAGKKLGCRAVDLLGGAYRQHVPVDYWCGRQTPEDLEKTVSTAIARGFTGLKMKAKLGDPVLEQVRAVRRAGGENFRLTIDPMFQWFSPHDILPVMRALDSVAQGVRLEDPFPQDQPDMWHRARATCSVPLIWHARDLTSLRRGLQERCADDYNCSGPLSEFMMMAHAVEALGHACWHGSAIELGVGQVAHLHAAAAARSCVLHSDFVSPLVREHTLITWDWPFANGALPLPPHAGLGIELDHDAVKHHTTAQIELT